jgi:hypothetical protein
MNKDEALRLALEALETLMIERGSIYEKAITAIKAALEAKDEPVAFKIYKPTPPRGAIPNVRDAELPWVYDQDPSSGNVASMWVTPVKATPPQRTWVGLTDEEIQTEWLLTPQHDKAEGIWFGRRLEAKLKEKEL